MFNKSLPQISMEVCIALLTKHIMLYDAIWGKTQNFNVLKRFFKIYLNGFDGAAHWRDQLMHTKSCEEALEVIRKM